MTSRLLRTDSAPPGHARADHVLAVFRAAGWKVAPAPAAANAGDASLSKAQAKYVVVVKVASEGRRDRLVPLLSQAILEARSIAKSRPTAGRPLAVIAAPRIPPLVADGLLAFAAAHAPGISVGVMDLVGLRAFAGPGLEALNGRPQAHGAGQAPTSEPRIHLFSDLNQWMLKVVLARHLHREDLLSGRAPRGALQERIRVGHRGTGVGDECLSVLATTGPRGVSRRSSRHDPHCPT